MFKNNLYAINNISYIIKQCTRHYTHNVYIIYKDYFTLMDINSIQHI